MLGTAALELQGVSESPAGPVKTGLLGPAPEFRIPEVWVTLEIYISNKLSADAAGLRPHLEKAIALDQRFFGKKISIRSSSP